MTNMEAKRMYVKPAQDLKVFDPVKRDFLPLEGREVRVSQYWLRRVKVGDCLKGEMAKASPAPAPQPKKEAPKKEVSKKQESKEGDK